MKLFSKVRSLLLLLLLSSFAFADGLRSFNFTSATSDIWIPLSQTGISYDKLTWNPVAMTGCSVQLDWSNDGVTVGGQIIPATTCTSPGASGVINANHNYVRMTVTSFTGTSVFVTWNGYVNNPGGGGGGCVTVVSTLSSVCGTVKGTVASVTDGSTASDCTTGGGSNAVACIYTGSAWAYAGSAAASPNFSAIGSGTNANTLLVSGTLNPTGGGIINANECNGVSCTPSGAVGYTNTGTGSSSSYNPLALDAAQESGADPCARIKAAVETTLPNGTNPGAVDGRGLSNTAIPCGASPFTTSDLGVIYWPNGLTTQTSTFTFGSGMRLIGGNRASGTAGLNGSAFTPAAAGTSGVPVATMTMGNSSTNYFGSEVDYSTLWGQSLLGSEGLRDISLQEEGGFDRLKVVDTTVCGYCIGGSTRIQHGGNITNSEFQVSSTGGASCGPNFGSTSTGVAISSWSMTGSGTSTTATVSMVFASSTGLFTDEWLYINGATAGAVVNPNGYRRVLSVSGTTATFNIYDPTLATSDSGTGGGVAWSYNVPMWVQTVATSLRPIRNVTLAGTNCTNTMPPAWAGAWIDGHGPFSIDQLHSEAFRTGIAIGRNAITDGVEINNADLESGSSYTGGTPSFPGGTGNCTETGIEISNQWGIPADILILDTGTTGSGEACSIQGYPTTSLLDNAADANGSVNTLARSDNPRVLFYAKHGTNGWTNSFLDDCTPDIQTGRCDDGTADYMFIAGNQIYKLSDTTGQFNLSPNNAGIVDMTIKAAASQSVDVFDVKANAGGCLLCVDQNGNQTVGGTTTWKGSTSGVVTVNASATGSHLQLNSTAAFIDTSGNLTVTSCTGCGGGGSGTVSGQASGVIPLATAATTIGAQSHMDDGNTTAATITSTENIAAPSFVGTGTCPVSGSGSGLACYIGSSASLPSAGQSSKTILYLGTSGAAQTVGTAAPIGIPGVGSCSTNQFETGDSIAAAPSCAQPSFSNLSGTATAAQIPAALSSTTSVNGTTIPSGGVTLTQTIANGTAAMGTSAISSGSCATVVTVSATGVATTDVITATPNADPTSVTGYAVSASGSLYIQAYPTANNVNFKVCNNTSASITPSALTLNWKVVR